MYREPHRAFARGAEKLQHRSYPATPHTRKIQPHVTPSSIGKLRSKYAMIQHIGMQRTTPQSTCGDLGLEACTMYWRLKKDASAAVTRSNDRASTHRPTRRRNNQRNIRYPATRIKDHRECNLHVGLRARAASTCGSP